MGTDLHALVEVSIGGAPWRPLRGTGMPMMGPRDYVLFSLLGDSRNHAGRHEPVWQKPRKVKDSEGTEHEIPGWWYAPDDGGHDRLEPISTPRGVPDDATLIWKGFVAMWEARGASLDVTWLTPEDITGGDWDQIVYQYGVLMEPDYLKLRDEGVIPTAHPANAGGPGLRVVNEIEYAAGERGENTTCISARWKAGTIREISGNFLDMVQEVQDTIPDASRLRFMLLFES